jgi:hypothetical protein
MLLKIVAANGGGSAPLRAPPGHLEQPPTREPAARLNMKGAYQKQCTRDGCDDDDDDCNHGGRTNTSTTANRATASTWTN